MSSFVCLPSRMRLRQDANMASSFCLIMVVISYSWTRSSQRFLNNGSYWTLSFSKIHASPTGLSWKRSSKRIKEIPLNGGIKDLLQSTTYKIEEVDSDHGNFINDNNSKFIKTAALGIESCWVECQEGCAEYSHVHCILLYQLVQQW